jgi:hypothetical protein
VVNSFWKFGVGKEAYEVVAAELEDIQKEQQLSHLAPFYTFTLVERVLTILEQV